MAKVVYPKLKNAPLQEVIFEIKWALDVDEDSGEEYDKQFPLKQGVFANAVKHEFPIYNQRSHPLLPERLFNYKPVHQFRKRENGYPLLQLGPGMFSANDAHPTYVWGDFEKVVKLGLSQLQNSYDDGVPPIIEVALRYINAIPLPSEGVEDVAGYIQKNLKISVHSHFLLDDFSPKAQRISVSQIFDIGGGTELSIQIITAFHAETNEPMLVWHVVVMQKGGVEFNQLEAWADLAHAQANATFHNMISNELHERFRA